MVQYNSQAPSNTGQFTGYTWEFKELRSVGISGEKLVYRVSEDSTQVPAKS